MKRKIALCSRGYMGVITSDKMQKVYYGDGKSSLAYVGYHIADSQATESGPAKKFGDLWSSRSPYIIDEMTKWEYFKFRLKLFRVRDGWPMLFLLLFFYLFLVFMGVALHEDDPWNIIAFLKRSLFD